MLAKATPATTPSPHRSHERLNAALLTAFAAGPAGRAHPARDNLTQLNITTATIRDITR